MPATKKENSNRRKKLSPLEQEIADLKAQLPSQQDWRSSDEQEIARRRLRALENPPAIRNLEPARRIHSTFEVTSFDSGRGYQVEIIDLSERLFFSTSPDFGNAGLGTCKHTESVLIHLRKRFPKLYSKAERIGLQHATLIVRNGDLALHGTGRVEIPRKLRLCVKSDGTRKESCAPEKLIATAADYHADGVRISNHLHRLAPTHLLNALLKSAQITAMKKAVTPPEHLAQLKEQPHLGTLPEHLQCFPSFEDLTEKPVDAEIEALHKALENTK